MSSRLPHDELETLIVADALGGLEDAEQERLARVKASHGPDCAECRRLVTEYTEVAGRIGLLLEPEPLSAGAEDALVAAARAQEPSGIEAPRGGRPARRWIAAVAVAAAVAIVAGVVGYALAPNQPALRTITLQGTVPGRVTLVYQPGRSDAVLVAAGLPDPGEGKVYELWYQPSAGARMRPAGVFTPIDGSAVAPATVGSSFVVVAVTIEPGPDGSPQPTSTPIFAKSL
jgi:hypothetical protein